MKKIITLFVFLIGITSCLSALAKMVVPGRTWWYSSGEFDRNYQVVLTYFGVRIDPPEAPDSDWLPCVAIDTLKNNVLDVPLAWLKENDGKVMVRPNLEIKGHPTVYDAKIWLILANYLGYTLGCELNGICGAYDLPLVSWNPENQTEFLLYDFNYEVGEGYEWLWTCMYVDSPLADTYLKRPLEIVSIEEKRNEYSGISYVRKSYRLNQGNGGWLEVLEDIGPIRGTTFSYLGPLYQWEGFFFAPLCYTNLLAEACLRQDLECPRLKYVEESDGRIIYYEDNWQGAIDNTLIDNHLIIRTFDLHGRQISNPLPGTVYIKNGKKYVK